MPITKIEVPARIASAGRGRKYLVFLKKAAERQVRGTPAAPKIIKYEPTFLASIGRATATLEQLMNNDWQELLIPSRKVY